MKFHYYPETDSLYIDLSEKKSVDSREVVPGVVMDFDHDAAGRQFATWRWGGRFSSHTKRAASPTIQATMVARP